MHAPLTQLLEELSGLLKTRRVAAAAGLFVTAIFLLPPHAAHARDLHGRLGLGYNGQFVNANAGDPATIGGREKVPGISFKFHLTRSVAASAVFGVATTGPTNSVTALKLFYNLFFENNLNFYTMLGAGLLNANTITGAQFLGGVGIEFFIPGLESLGFAIETGAAFDNLSGGFVVRTMGVSFLDAGVHFYF